MSELITIKVYDDYISASITKDRLEHEGVFCFLKDEQTITMNWLWSQALGGIKLQVRQEDVDRALAIIKLDTEHYEQQQVQPAYDENLSGQLDPNNKVCINCGSHNTKQSGYEKGIAYSALLVLGFPVGVKSDKWHCFHCGKDF